MKGKKMTEKKSQNKSDASADYLTLDGVAKLLDISRMTLYNIRKSENSNFPKGFIIVKSKKNRPTKLYKRTDIIDWLENQTPRS
jgi:predicted DNA-binding transcriptional regulator AlpA